MLAAFLLLTLAVIAIRCAIIVVVRGCQLSVNLGMVLGETLALAAIWPIEWLIDQAEKALAFAADYRAQRKIWRAEFRAMMSWDEFRRQMTGQPKVERDDYADALSLFGLVEPFARPEMDARFKKDHARRPSRHGRFRLSGAASHSRARPGSQAKRMEEMSHKSELAILRQQQLAKVREATGTPERFVADFACALHDRAFRVTFARFSSAQRFRCESVDKTESHQATTLARLQGFLRPADALRVRTEEVDFSTFPAPGAGTTRAGRSATGAKCWSAAPAAPAFFQLPRQLRRAIPDCAARCPRAARGPDRARRHAHRSRVETKTDRGM